jgi:hypothetical protein
MGPAGRPSFAYLIAQGHRRKDYPVVGVLDKVVCRRLLESVNAPLPQSHTVLPSIDRLTPGLLVAPCVLKPVKGSSSRGVLLLDPTGPDEWHELASGARYTFDGLRDAIEGMAPIVPVRGPWIVEELLLRPGLPLTPAVEVKAYTFRGHVAFVYVCAHRPTRVHHFTAQGTSIDVGKPRGMVDETLGLPDDVDSYVALASRISRHLPIPFVRVDMYVTERGPVCGELTPLPGGSRTFSDAWDEHLGLLYEQAESALLTELADWPGMFDSPEAWAAVADRAARIRSRDHPLPDPPASVPAPPATGAPRRRGWRRQVRP